MVHDEEIVCTFCGKDLAENVQQVDQGGNNETGTIAPTNNMPVLAVLSLVLVLISFPLAMVTPFVGTFILYIITSSDLTFAKFSMVIAAFAFNVPLYLSFIFAVRTLNNNKRKNLTRGRGLSIASIILCFIVIIFTFFMIEVTFNMPYMF